MPLETPRRPRRASAILVASIAAIIVVGGLTHRWSRAEHLREHASAQAVPTVAVVTPSPIAATDMELPARIEAWSRAPIYARVSGYLKTWRHDIGSKVHAGDVLAEIETPDLDQSLQQARAQLDRARSEEGLAETSAKRWQSMLALNAVSQQEVEERNADLLARRADVNALQANLERMQTQQRFKRLTAPFDGIVTGRNTDVGSLINVGMSPGSELFVVSDTSRLRVYVDVPQRQVVGIREGAGAKLTVPERADRTYDATVQSLAHAIDTGTGAMRVQLTVDNAHGDLLPGGFATVRFDTAASTTATSGGLGVPPSALILGGQGVQIATVDADGRAQLRQVRVARDYGNVIEFADGLGPQDRVIANPPDGLASGDPVRVAASSK